MKFNAPTKLIAKEIEILGCTLNYKKRMKRLISPEEYDYYYGNGGTVRGLLSQIVSTAELREKLGIQSTGDFLFSTQTDVIDVGDIVEVESGKWAKVKERIERRIGDKLSHIEYILEKAVV